mmetsp:Transcript_11388/g.29615  ORF Transcript_11388/g.29615 Transcript_11388/m.29615 type:complete len:262 (-) Transcript_11388:295-1080(-)
MSKTNELRVPVPGLLMLELLCLECALFVDLLQVVVVVLRANLRRAHAGEHVLFDQRPARVVGLCLPVRDRLEVHTTLAKLAEDAVLDRLKVVPAVHARLLSDAGLAILAVHVLDAVSHLCEILVQRTRVVLPAAVHDVASIKREVHILWVSERAELVYLCRRLDVACTVRVKAHTHVVLLEHGLADHVRTIRKDSPFLIRETHLRRHTTSVLRAHRVRAILVSEHQHWAMAITRHRAEQLAKLQRLLDAGRVLRRILQLDR